MLPGRFDERGGGAGLSRTDLGGRSESCNCMTWRTGIGERVVERAGESGSEEVKGMGGVEEDTMDDVDLDVCEREKEGAWKVAETTLVSSVWGF